MLYQVICQSAPKTVFQISDGLHKHAWRKQPRITSIATQLYWLCYKTRLLMPPPLPSPLHKPENPVTFNLHRPPPSRTGDSVHPSDLAICLCAKSRT